LVLTGLWVAAQQRHGGQNGAGRTEAALYRARLDECPLYRMQLTVTSQAFDGQYLVPVGLPCQHQTRVDRLTIQQHRARTTFTLAAAILGTGQAQVVTQQI
jgi:hypothetical protein